MIYAKLVNPNMSQKELDSHLDDSINAGIYWFIKTRGTTELRILDIYDFFNNFNSLEDIILALEDMVNRGIIKIES